MYDDILSKYVNKDDVHQADTIKKVIRPYYGRINPTNKKGCTFKVHPFSFPLFTSHSFSDLLHSPVKPPTCNSFYFVLFIKKPIPALIKIHILTSSPVG